MYQTPWTAVSSATETEGVDWWTQTNATATPQDIDIRQQSCRATWEGAGVYKSVQPCYTCWQNKRGTREAVGICKSGLASPNPTLACAFTQYNVGWCSHTIPHFFYFKGIKQARTHSSLQSNACLETAHFYTAPHLRAFSIIGTWDIVASIVKTQFKLHSVPFLSRTTTVPPAASEIVL